MEEKFLFKVCDKTWTPSTFNTGESKRRFCDKFVKEEIFLPNFKFQTIGSFTKAKLSLYMVSDLVGLSSCAKTRFNDKKSKIIFFILIPQY